MAAFLARYPPLQTPTYTNPQPSNMQRGGRYRNNRGGRKAASSQRLKGCFADGIWHCNCRLPAVNFTVKKEGPNKGRHFYTCQQNEPKRCDFFLWGEDAQLREQAAVMGNSRSEPKGGDADVHEGWNVGRMVQPQGRGLFSTPAGNKYRDVDDDTPTPTPSPSPPAANVSKKRNAHDALLDDDEDQAWSVSGDMEDEMARVAAVATPQKAQKTGVYATPATTGKRTRKIPWLEPVEPMTPASTSKKTVLDYFNNKDATPSKPSRKTVKFEEPEIEEEPETPVPRATAAIAPPASPSPVRHRDALVDPADSASSLTSEVLAQLSSIRIPPERLSSIRSTLSKHDLRTQGVTKGRDISRLALKAKEAKILELEAKVASLESEREHDRGMIARLRWKKEIGEEDDEESL